MVTEPVETMDGLSLDERVRLGQSNAHAFRHYARRRTISGERAPAAILQGIEASVTKIV
jgi:hypothetical protein